MCSSFVYILATGKNGQIKFGLTHDLVHQVWQYRSGQMDVAGAPTPCKTLVWHEAFDDLAAAEARLDRLSRWPAAWLTRLIEETNPDWTDQWTTLDDQPKIDINTSTHYLSPAPQTTPTYPVIRPMLQVA